MSGVFDFGFMWVEFIFYKSMYCILDYLLFFSEVEVYGRIFYLFECNMLFLIKGIM